jgi:hypothetical protein
MGDIKPPPRVRSDAKSVPEATGKGISRLIAPLALLVALIGVGLAAWSLISPPSDARAGGQLSGDPKARVCNAFNVVSKAVQVQTHADLGPDPVAQTGVAANARLAMVGGGEYLRSQLDSETPSELADAVGSFASNLQDIGMNALAEVPGTDPSQAARLSDGEAGMKQIADLCK